MFFPTLRQDVRQATRLLVHSPGFTLVAVSALALGIGANTAIFSVVNSILLEPLPYRQPDRLVRLVMHFRDGNANVTSVPKFMAWKDNTTAFQYICAYNFSGPGLNLGGGGFPEQVKGIHVSADFFPVFDATPAIGRVFTPGEDKPGGPHFAVMSHGLWVRRFGGDPRVIGQAILLGGEPWTVIGVLRTSFRSYPPADLFLPLQADANTTNQAHYLSAAARLKPGITLEEAKAQMKIAAGRFRQANPRAMNRDESATAEPFQEAMVGDVRKPLLILLGAVALVLLIACANVANLLLARATDRAREVAIRAALGSGRWRIVRQLLTESLLLAIAGGAAGLLLGVWGARALVKLMPANLPRAAEFADSAPWDWHILAFTAGVSVLTGIVFGLFPAVQISRADVNIALKENSSRSATGRRQWVRNLLVVMETAIALVLLTGAALLIHTFASLRKVDAGFNPRHVLSFETSLAGSKYQTTAAVDRLSRDAVRRIESLPGVTAAAMAPFLPLEGGFGLGFQIVGRPLKPGEEETGDAVWTYVSESYFRALQIPVRRGRVFDERDTRNSPLVVAVNESFAKHFWPKGHPLGERIVIGKGMGPEFAEGPREVVGVVGDVKEGGLGAPAPDVMYIPLPQLRDSFMALNNTILPVTWVVRTSANPLTLSAAVRNRVLEADRQLPIAHIRSVDEVVAETTARQNFNMTLLTVFAGIALLLAAIGVYGMLSYAVQHRSQEIGIRMALGAQRSDVLRMVVGRGMALAGAGMTIGLAGALGLTRLLSAILFDIKPNDPLTFGEVAALLALISLAACWIPAHRATRVDPMQVLRYE